MRRPNGSAAAGRNGSAPSIAASASQQSRPMLKPFANGYGVEPSAAIGPATDQRIAAGPAIASPSRCRTPATRAIA